MIGYPMRSAIAKAIREATIIGLDWGYPRKINIALCEARTPHEARIAEFQEAMEKRKVLITEIVDRKNGPYIFPEKWSEEQIREMMAFPDKEFYKNYINSPKEGNMFNDEDLASLARARNLGRNRSSEPKHGREVRIRQVDNGFLVQVGCATFVETSRKRIFAALCEYWSDPDKAAKKYYYDKQKK